MAVVNGPGALLRRCRCLTSVTVSSAVEALNALLAAAEKDDDEDDDGNASATGPLEELRKETRAWMDFVEARLDSLEALPGRKE